jgi:hypothetical protein
MHLFPAIVVGVIIGLGILYGIKWINMKNKLKELAELEDCPFKFTLDLNDNIIFQLCENTTLWCDYGFGIRSDGVYGIDGIRLLGINAPFGEISNLKIGQSVFPIIKAMEEFIVWSKDKPFKTEFKDGFEREWNSMKKNLDNLRYLESEAKKKEKKSK